MIVESSRRPCGQLSTRTRPPETNRAGKADGSRNHLHVVGADLTPAANHAGNPAHRTQPKRRAAGRGCYANAAVRRTGTARAGAATRMGRSGEPGGRAASSS